MQQPTTPGPGDLARQIGWAGVAIWLTSFAVYFAAFWAAA